MLDNTIIEPTYKIIIPQIVHAKLMYYTRAASGEISGLGRTKFMDDDEILVEDVLLFKQECTQGSTDLDQDTLSRFLFKIIQKGKDPTEYRLWWHTHNDFGTFWSSTDTDNIEMLSKDSTLVSICVNKLGETKVRVDTNGVEATDVSLVIKSPRYKGLRERCIREVRRKVSNVTLNTHIVDDVEEQLNDEEDEEWLKELEKRSLLLT